MDAGRQGPGVELVSEGAPPAGRVVTVGDRLGTDVLMAKRAGLVAVLTLSGVTRPEDLERSDVKPDHVIESLAELPRLDARLGS